MRAALLPAGGDPFLLAYWLRNYRTWADEVDELRITVCGQNNPDAMAYMRQIVADVPHAYVDFLPLRTDHGVVLMHLTQQTSADLVVFLEDDSFVRRPGVIAERFERIESGRVDVVGTARGNASPELVEVAARRFGPLPQTPSGETGHSLYPCFLFARRADLLSICTNFSTNGWLKGTYISSLDFTAEKDEASDTFVLGSWELRAAGLRIDAEAAYRSGTMSADAPWFHVGSLSSGYGGSFMSDMNSRDYANHVASVRPKHELIDWHKRFSWWTRVSDPAIWDGGIPEHHAEYVAALYKYIADVEADPAEIARWRASFDQLITWAE